MLRFFFSATDEYRKKLPYGFAGVGCFYEQEHVKRPGGREETEWVYPFYQWIQCREGSGEVWLQGKKYGISKGQGMLLLPNEPHEYMSVDGKWIVDWVIFDGAQTAEFIKNVMKAEYSGIYSLAYPNDILELTSKLFETAITENPMKYIISSGIVYQILLNIYINAFTKQAPALTHKAERLKPVFAYISTHYAEVIPLETLAQKVKVTPQHLCNIFKSLTGQTLTEYINVVRIGKSKELLKSTDMLIKEIAPACGFEDVSYFCEIFKRSEGMTPTAFRGR